MLIKQPTVFSRCADSVEQGRRLENLSWRLWQREQLIETEKAKDAIAENSTTTTTSSTLTKPVPVANRAPELPQLSGSVDSVADEDANDFISESAPVEIRPRIHRLDSTVSSRSRRDRHISSDDFEKMVVSIVKDTAPLSAPTATSPLASAAIKEPLITPERSGSTTAESQDSKDSEETEPSPDMHPASGSSHTFTPSQVPVPEAFPQPAQAGSIQEPIPEPTSSPAHQPVHLKKAPAKFALGGSCSSSEPAQSMEASNASLAVPAKKGIFQLGGSSEEDASVKSDTRPALPGLSAERKQALAESRARAEAESAIDSDTEDEYVDESAIDDDDDSSDWEDSLEDSGKSSVDEKYFQRVESKANLTSRPSLITLMLAQDHRAKNLGNPASQSTSAIPRPRAVPNGPSLGVSPNDSDEGPLMMKGTRPSHPSPLKPIIEVPRSNAQPITAPANHVHAQAALSPRTTRRNMLATELTESLRRHLLWERQQKSSTANAVLKRRHTSHDVANLKQYPEKPCMKQAEDVNASSWNQYFAKDAFDSYHSKGW